MKNQVSSTCWAKSLRILTTKRRNDYFTGLCNNLALRLDEKSQRGTNDEQRASGLE